MPSFSLKIKQEQEKFYYWDKTRAKWLVLTPEEWTRQHVLNLLTAHLGFTSHLIKAEHPAQVGTATNQRIDLLCYNKKAEPILLVECKAPSVKISSATLSQAIRYNSVAKAKYIMLSNGLEHFIYQRKEDENYITLKNFPNFCDEEEQR